MSDKKEIKSYSTAFLMSLAVHTLLLLLIIVFSKASLDANKIVVIDLTLMDPIAAGAKVSGDKKVSAVYELKKKQEKTASEDVKPVKKQKREEVKEEKSVASIEAMQDHETPQVDEKLSDVKKGLLAQDSEHSFLSEDQEVSELAGTLLSSARETPEASLGEKDESVINKEKSFPGGTGDKGVLGGYLKSHLSYIKDIIQENITYPDTARRNGWMGKVKVSFVIANNGRAKDIKVIQSSGFNILDKSAKEAVSRSSPFPHPPAEARIIIPILYTLR